MLSFLPAPLLGLISLILNLLNLTIVPSLAIIAALIRLIMPNQKWRQMLTDFLHEDIPNWWISGNNLVIKLTTKTEWEIQGDRQLDPQGWYLLICNHQSWLDIIVLERMLGNQIPILKFFMKKQLLWGLPIAGLACYLMGFPFVERYSKEYLKKHPEKAGKDLEITRKACEAFKDQPITIMIYPEGTRFTNKKHQQQKSPFKHLLKPKAGGVAFVLEAMDGHLHNIIDATIIYPDSKTNLWQFMCGKTKKIILHYQTLPIPKELTGDYYHNPEVREQFQAWLNERWIKKDRLLDDNLKGL